MEYLSFDETLLSALSQPVLLSAEGQIAYMNPAARSLLWRTGTLPQVGDPLPSELPQQPDAECRLTLGDQSWQVLSRSTPQGLLYLFSPAGGGKGLSRQEASLLSSSLRTTMSPLIMSMERLQNTLAETEFERHRELLSVMNHSYYRVLHIVDSLSVYSTLSASPDQPRRTTQINLTELCQELFEELRFLLDMDNKTITYRPPERFEALYVEGEQDLIERLIYQLCANALKTADQLTLSLQRRQNRILLTISDNGTGMPDEVASHGYALAPVYEGDYPVGLGFGLPICRRIVQRHGGTFVHAPRASGCAVSVSLPLLPADSVSTVHQSECDIYTGVSHALVELSEVLPHLCYDPAAFL